MGLGKGRLQMHGFVVVGLGGGTLSELDQSETKVDMSLRIGWVQPERIREVSNSRTVSTPRKGKQRQLVVGSWGVNSVSERVLELVVGFIGLSRGLQDFA